MVYAAVLLVALALLAFVYLRQPKARIYQWGRVVRTRPGLKGHPQFADEPDEVSYVDYRHWVRLKPNPGFCLPLVGRWSRHYGRTPREVM